MLTHQTNRTPNVAVHIRLIGCVCACTNAGIELLYTFLELCAKLISTIERAQQWAYPLWREARYMKPLHALTHGPVDAQGNATGLD